MPLTTSGRGGHPGRLTRRAARKPGSARGDMSALDRLIERIGIEPEFTDASGNPRLTDPDVERHLAEAMGFDAGDEAAALATLGRLDDQAARTLLPPVVVTTRPGERVDIPLNAAARTMKWQIVGEHGWARSGDVTTMPGDAGGRAKRLIPIAAPTVYGRYRLRVEGDALPPTETTLLVAPEACWVPDVLSKERKLWGIALQLYLLRSERNWGIGDFGDLVRFVGIAADLGADMIGLNPLNAMFLDDPEHASPYSPASRLFLNVLYIDVAAVAGFDTDPAVRSLVEAPEFRERLDACRAADLVDYTGVAALKLPVLEALHRAFRDGAGDAAAFAAFRVEQGQPLERFCRFSALRERFAAEAPERADWRHWPEPFRDCRSEAVARFAEDHAERVGFFAWTQWIADCQLGRAAAEARARGMAVGLYRDLAVGADAGGAESWSNPGTVFANLQVGAPPDMLNPAGQNWVLPPFDPMALRDEAYASYADLVRANMRHAGGLRIDHVMALRHLYLIPEGRPPAEGAYVTYPMDDLIAVLALESHERRCLVVGEDLGTVPEGFRERMSAAKVLSYRVVIFERDEEGDFLQPEDYPALALAMLGSHDLATLRGWWEGRDIDLKARHSLYPSPEEEARQRAQRQVERRAFLKALRKAGLLRGTRVSLKGPFGEALAKAAHAFLARTRSGLAVAQLEDLLDQGDQVNLPGTIDEYPNWRRRYDVPLERIATNPFLGALVGALARGRKPGARRS